MTSDEGRSNRSVRPPGWCRPSMPRATPARRAVVVSERVAVVAAGSVLRGSLRIGRAMAAAVALVDLLCASPGLAGAASLIDAADNARLCARPAQRGAARPPGRPGDLERLPRPARPRDRPARGGAAARVRDRAHCYGLQPAHDRALDDPAATNRPGPETAASADLFVLPGAACCSPLCRWKCSSTVSGRVRKGRCPASSAGRLRVREPDAGPSWRDAGRARCLQDALPFRQRATVRAAREPGCRAPARATASGGRRS